MVERVHLVLARVACAALFVCLSAGPAWAGQIRGRIVVSRVLTKKRVAIPAYAMRGPSVVAPVAASPFSPAAELKRTVIYLEPFEPTSAPLPKAVVATLRQKNQRFDPDVIVVPAGSTISFPNSDPIFHNVFSLSSARQFDLGYYPAGATREVKFDQPGIIQVYCHIHPDMSAAIVVVPTSWYAQPAEDGGFSFEDLPPGSYYVTVWHRSAGFFRRKVKVSGDGALNMILEIPVQEVSD
jgi:plastocyanin